MFFHRTLMTEPLHKQFYDKFVKCTSNMQQTNIQLSKKMRFPSPQPCWPGYGKRACQFIDCAAGVVSTELARPGGCLVALATGEGGGHHGPLPVHAPSGCKSASFFQWFFEGVICSDLQWFARVLQCFLKVGRLWFAVICRVQISCK